MPASKRQSGGVSKVAISFGAIMFLWLISLFWFQGKMSSAESQGTQDRQRVIELLQKKGQLESQVSEGRAKFEAEHEHVMSLEADVAKLKGENSNLKKKIEGLEASSSQKAEPSTFLRGSQATGAGAAAPNTAEGVRAMARNDAIAVVVIACKRPQYLKRALDSVLGQPRDAAKFPVIVSQDGFDQATSDLIKREFGTRVFHMHHEHDPQAEQIAARSGGHSALGYVYIAQHYGFALRKAFDEFGFNQVIFLEEDMEISPDFYSYFGSALPLLKNDKNLFCVSAWNDNGYASLVKDPKAMYRTDFFPGLGWMLTKSMWDEIRHRWPNAYWDEFMRRPDVRKGRQCLRPEINRDFTFGAEGTSSGQFFNEHLNKIKLNKENVDWGKVDLSNLASAEAFDAWVSEQIKSATAVSLSEVDYHQNEVLRVRYDDRQYDKFARKFNLMPDEKEGIRRMSYRGVIPFAYNNNRIFLHTPSFPVL